MKNLIIALALIFATTTVADEYGYMYAKINETSADVQLMAGDKMVVLSTSMESGNEEVSVSIRLPDGELFIITPYIRYGNVSASSEEAKGSKPQEGRTIAGPCAVFIDGGPSYAAYRIVRAAHNSIQPSNVISLPADINGDMQVIVETSINLLDWDQVYSFTHDSTDSSSRFFRTRVIQSP